MANLINKTFGNWKVLSETEGRSLSGNIRYYKCKCSCGVEKDVREESLINKLSTSCGCKRQKRRKELNVGAEFGSWQIINSTFNSKKEEMYYYFVCNKCEMKIEGFHSELHSLMKTACSCNLGAQGFKKGNRYGNWIIVGPGSKGSKKAGDKYYLCQCDCGTLREVVDSSLRKMLSTSCGCSRVNSQKQVATMLTFDPRDSMNDFLGNWKVIRRDLDNDTKMIECTSCEIKIEVNLRAVTKKCPVCSHSLDFEKIKDYLCGKYNLLNRDKLYFRTCLISDVGSLTYVISDDTFNYAGELRQGKTKVGYPKKNSPIVNSELSIVIEDLKLSYEDKYIVENKNDLHPLLKEIGEWDLTKIILQGYYVEHINIFKKERTH